MNPLFSIPLLAAATIAGAVVVSRVVAWSFSTSRRHRLTAKTARHRATRRTA